MRTVDIGIGHDHDLVVARLRDIPLLAEAAADRGNEGPDLVVREHAVDPRLLDVQHLAAQGQDRLRRAVAAGLRRAACGIALDEKELGLRRVALGAVAELAGKRETVHHALAPRRLARGPRGLSGASGEEGLLDHRLRDGGVLLEEGHQPVGDDGADDSVDFAVAELRLGLALELRLRDLDADDDREALAHVVARKRIELLLLEELVVEPVLLDRRCERAAEARKMRAALDRVDVVAVRLLERGVAVGVLERDLGLHHACRALLRALEVDDGGDRLLVLVQVLDELVYAAVVVEGLLVVGIALVVAEVYRHPLVEEGELAETRAEDLPLERVAREDRVVGEERDFRARLAAALADDLERLRDVAARKLDVVHLAVALHLDLHPVGKSVHAAHADAVETAGDLVVGAVELAAGVENREHDLDRGLVLRRMHVDGNAAAVVLDGERAVWVDDYVDHRTVARERLVDRIVYYFVYQVVVAAFARVADVHRRTFADGLHALQNLYVFGVVVALFFCHLSHPFKQGYYTIFSLSHGAKTVTFREVSRTPRRSRGTTSPRIRGCRSPLANRRSWRRRRSPSLSGGRRTRGTRRPRTCRLRRGR